MNFPENEEPRRIGGRFLIFHDGIAAVRLGFAVNAKDLAEGDGDFADGCAGLGSDRRRRTHLLGEQKVAAGRNGPMRWENLS